jgi:hypothetical protein
MHLILQENEAAARNILKQKEDTIEKLLIKIEST